MNSILQLAIGLLKRHKQAKNILAFSSAFVFLLSTWVFLGIHFAPDWWFTHFHIHPALASEPLLGILLGSGALLGLCFLATQSVIDFDTLEIELKPIRKEREEIRQRIEQGSTPNVLNTIQLGLNQITEYYTINKSQARNSFSFAVFAVVMGLLTLIGGIWLFYFGKTQNIGLAALSGIGGLLLQFIGGASFYIYNKSLSQLNYFYDKLVRMQDTMLSIQLCSQLENAERRSAIQERLILEILTRQGNLSIDGANRAETGGLSTNDSTHERIAKAAATNE
jgi:hypothetical protein